MAKKVSIRSWDTPVDETKLGNFWQHVQELANQEFGVDDEGDSTIEVSVVDRTRYQRSHFLPVPYEHKATSQNELDGVERTIMTNLGIAYHAVDTFHRVKQAKKFLKS